MKALILAVSLMLPFAAEAQDRSAVIAPVVETHILPRFAALAESGAALSAAAQADCDPDSEALRNAYAEAFDARTAASHLRFGPTETDSRAFALAFWPDTRGFTPKALAGMIASEDPVVDDPAAFADVSVAARGFYGLEFMLHDDTIRAQGSAEYRCRLTRALAADIAATAQAINDDWTGGYADLLLTAGQNDTYRSTEEALQELYKALMTGLEFTKDSRLGRPLGSFDNPRPARAEAWRSGRSLHHVELSLASLEELALLLAAEDAAVRQQMADAFATAREDAAALDDPVFAGVANPLSRIRVEALQGAVNSIRTAAMTYLGPGLGVAEGFNALDGD